MADTDQQRPAKDDRRPAKDDRKWTVLVFMGADNLPEETDLNDAADADIEEMREALNSPDARAVAGPSNCLEVVYQRHSERGVTREHLRRGVREPVPVDTPPSAAGALMDFIMEATAMVGHRPGIDHTILILWGHAHRFAIGAHKVAGKLDALAFGEISGLLAQAEGRGQLDIVAFDACDVATIEMAVELAPVARYLLASQITMPIPGFPYTRILERLVYPEGRLMGPAEFGSWAVRRFCEFYTAGDKEHETVSLTLLDLQQTPEVLRRTEALALALAAALPDSEEAEVDLFLSSFRRSMIVEEEPKPFVDVADLCLNLLIDSRDLDVKAAALALGDLLLSPRPVQPGASLEGEGRPFVVEHGGNACITARLNGVSLFAPHVTGDGIDRLALQRYDALRFGSSAWRQLVVALAGG